MKKKNKKKKLKKYAIAGIALLSVILIGVNSYRIYDFASKTIIDVENINSDKEKMNKIRGQGHDDQLKISTKNATETDINLAKSKLQKNATNFFVKPRKHNRFAEEISQNNKTEYINYFTTTKKVHLLSMDHKHGAYTEYNPAGNYQLISRYNDRLLEEQKQNNVPIYQNMMLEKSIKSQSLSLSPIYNNLPAYWDKSNAFKHQKLHFYYPLAENLLIRDDSITRVNGDKLPVITKYNPNYEEPNIFRKQRHAQWQANKGINTYLMKYKAEKKGNRNSFNYQYVPYQYVIKGDWDNDLFDTTQGYVPTMDYREELGEDNDLPNIYEVQKYLEQKQNGYLSYRLSNRDWSAYFDNSIKPGSIFTLKDKLSKKRISPYYIDTKNGRRYLPVFADEKGHLYVHIDFDKAYLIRVKKDYTDEPDEIKKSGYYENTEDDEKRQSAIPVKMILMIAGHYVKHE